MNRPPTKKLSAPKIDNVRRRALEAARTLLAEGGMEALQIRVIAARIGCAVGAIYYHFTDKQGLMVALAVEGFQEMSAGIREAIAARTGSSQIHDASLAYFRFMRANLQLYELMHDPQIFSQNEGVKAAEHDAFVVFESALIDDPRVPPERREQIALVCWLLGKGAASALISSGARDAVLFRELFTEVLAGFNFLLSPSFTI